MEYKNFYSFLTEDIVKESEIIALLEFPQRIKTWSDDKLQNSKNNYEFTKILKEKTKRTGQFDNCEIYSYKSGKFTIDAFIKGDFIIAFFMNIVNGTTVTEFKVWQDSINFGLCRKIIFGYYLKNYNTFISDGLHSELGEKYWVKLMSDASKDGYQTLVDFNGKLIEYNVDDIEKYYSNHNIRFVIKK